MILRPLFRRTPARPASRTRPKTEEALVRFDINAFDHSRFEAEKEANLARSSVGRTQIKK